MEFLFSIFLNDNCYHLACKTRNLNLVQLLCSYDKNGLEAADIFILLVYHVLFLYIFNSGFTPLHVAEYYGKSFISSYIKSLL